MPLVVITAIALSLGGLHPVLLVAAVVIVGGLRAAITALVRLRDAQSAGDPARSCHR